MYVYKHNYKSVRKINDQAIHKALPVYEKICNIVIHQE